MLKGWGKISILVGIIAAFLIITYFFTSLRKEVCKDFKSQEEASEALQRDPVRYEDLDRDKDGIVCEELPVQTKASIIERVIPVIPKSTIRVQPLPSPSVPTIKVQGEAKVIVEERTTPKPTQNLTQSMQPTPNQTPSPTSTPSPSPSPSCLITVAGICL